MYYIYIYRIFHLFGESIQTSFLPFFIVCSWLISRLIRKINPSSSHNRPFIRSHLLPQKRNNALQYGSRSHFALIMTASPSINFLMSVYPVTIYTVFFPYDFFQHNSRTRAVSVSVDTSAGRLICRSFCSILISLTTGLLLETSRISCVLCSHSFSLTCLR